MSLPLKAFSLLIVSPHFFFPAIPSGRPTGKDRRTRDDGLSAQFREKPGGLFNPPFLKSQRPRGLSQRGVAATVLHTLLLAYFRKHTESDG